METLFFTLLFISPIIAFVCYKIEKEVEYTQKLNKRLQNSSKLFEKPKYWTE